MSGAGKGIGDWLGGIFSGSGSGGGGGGGGFGGIGDAIGGVVDKVGGFIGDIFGFAKGGYIKPGQVGLVGEKGPELISGPANITPLDNMSSRTTNVNYNIHAVDARSFTELLARDPGMIYSLSEMGRQKMGI